MEHFVNEYVSSDDSIEKIMGAYWKWKLKKSRWLIAAVMIFGLIMLLVSHSGTYIMVEAAGIAVLVMFHMRIKQAIKIEQERKKMLNPNDGGKMRVEIGDNIHMKKDGSSRAVTFEHVKKVLDAGEYIVVCMDGMMVMGMKKDGFIEGTAEECVRYLREKAGCR